MALTPTNKNNPCPICENTSGSCRQGKEDSGYWQCMTYADAKKGEVIGRWKSLGSTKNKQWGQFKPDNSGEWTEEKRREWQIENQRRNVDLARKDKEAREKSLSAIVRHEQYTHLLAELSLHPDDRADLVRRGFTHEQIELSGFKSIESYQRLQAEFNKLLPGLSASGNNLVIKEAGYLCPVRNADGLIVACQVRVRALATGESNRYKWLSSSQATLHVDGELPLAIHTPQKLLKFQIGLCEGVGAKPFLASQRLGIPFIGAAGGQHANSPEIFKDLLQQIEDASWQVAQETGLSSIAEAILSQRSQRESRSLLNKDKGFRAKQKYQAQSSNTGIEQDCLDTQRQSSYSTSNSTQWLKERLLNSLQATLNSTNSSFNPSETQNHKPAESQSSFQIEIVITPDAGDILNHQVMSRWHRVTALLGQWGWLIKVAWWGQISKDAGDIDEIDLSTTGIEYLNPDKFWVMAEEAKREWERDERIRQAQEPLRKLTYTPDIEISSRYIPHDIISQLPKSGLIGLKAPKGSGKSVFIKALIEVAKAQGVTILSITPRIALGREQAIKWEITWIDDYGQMQTRAESTAQQIEKLALKKSELTQKLKAPQQLQIVTDQSENTLDGIQAEIAAIAQQIDNINRAAYNALGLCWDSLWRTKERDMKNALIIIDEAELGFTHMATSRTCNSRRAEILKIFSDKLTECLTNGGRVILSDADLTNTPIDYIGALLPFRIKPFVVTNNYKGAETKWRVDYRLGSRGSTLAQVILLLKAGCHLAITTDSQAEAEALERKILQECPELCSFIQDGEITELAKKGTPPVIRIDRKITEYKAGQHFIQHPNEEILRWQPKCLIYTPSMGVGVSIDEHVKRGESPYFDAVVGLFFGVIEPSQCRQQLARVRANVQRIVWSATTGMSGEGCQSFFPEEINQHSYKYQQWGLSINNIASANLGEVYDDGELIDEVYRLRTEHFDNTSRTWNNPHIDLFAKLKARNNYGRANLAKLLIEELKEEGHDVFVVGGVAEEITGEIKEIKDEIKQEDAERIDKSPVVTPDQAKEISRKATATQTERDSAQKALLKEKLPGVEITQEFLYKAVTKDRGKWLRQHELFWHVHNTDAAKERDLERYFKKLHSFAKGTAFTPDIFMEMPKIDVIRKSGLFDLVDVNDPDKIYQGNSDEAQAFLRRCYKIAKELKIAFGGREQVTTKSHPLRVANSLLCRLGLKLKKVNKSKNDTRYQIDRATLEDGDRHAVLESFSKAWELLQQRTKVCDSLPTGNLEEIYGYGSCPKNAPNPEPEKDIPMGGIDIVFKTKMQIPPLPESQSECDSCVDQSPLETKYLDLEEKARDEGNSSNLVTDSEIGQLYKVRCFEGSFGAVATTPSAMWLPNCRLVQLPSQLRDYYAFESPDGNRIAVADEDCFEPMEVEPTATLGEKLLAALRSEGEVLREFLGGMSQFDAWSAVMDAEALNPSEFSRLPEIAPDWVSWMPATASQ